MTVAVTLLIGGQPLEAVLDDAALAAIAAAVANASSTTAPASDYLTVKEAAELLRAKPQRVHDLTSSRRLSRFKDGSRTLISRAELADYLAREGTRRRA